MGIMNSNLILWWGLPYEQSWPKVPQCVCYFHCLLSAIICSILVLLWAGSSVAQRSCGWAESRGLMLLAGYLKPPFPFPFPLKISLEYEYIIQMSKERSGETKQTGTLIRTKVIFTPLRGKYPEAGISGSSSEYHEPRRNF